MSKDVAPQVDVGALSLRSLSAFVPMLAAMSADDVAPTALIQLSQLGSLFHTSGSFAEQVPDLLRRHSSMRLERLSLAIGWKKGDAASYMADTAGGQSIALLCFCLQNILQSEDTVGGVLYDLSERDLPKVDSVSSIKQLDHTSKILYKKLGHLGFGQMFAKEVRRLFSVYASLLKPPTSSSFFSELTRESLVQLLSTISKAFSEDGCQVRIRGVHGMAFIITLMMALFPSDTAVTVEELTVYEGIRRLFILEIQEEDTEGPIQIFMEHILPNTPGSIVTLPIESPSLINRYHRYQFQWNGHVKDSLTLSFASVGLNCPNELLVACCDEILFLSRRKRPESSGEGDNTVAPRKLLQALLGSYPEQHVHRTCKDLLGAVPTNSHNTESVSTFLNLLACFERAIAGRACSCTKAARCYRTDELGFLGKESLRGTSNCVPRALWRSIGNAIAHCLVCTLIDASSEAVIEYEINTRGSSQKIIGWPALPWNSCESIQERVFRCVVQGYGRLAASNGSSTLFPVRVQTMQADFETGYRFRFVSGQILFKSHYYSEIRPVQTHPRKLPVQYLQSTTGIFPSNEGEHDTLSFAYHEQPSALELNCTITIKGRNIGVNIYAVLTASMGLEEADWCDHDLPIDVKLDEHLVKYVWPLSVAAPDAKNAISIVQTLRNPVAQLLACTPGQRALVQRDCCISCAVRQAQREGFQKVIVAC